MDHHWRFRKKRDFDAQTCREFFIAFLSINFEETH
jgi:hypothetical protein